jgi:hypothetical protein
LKWDWPNRRRHQNKRRPFPPLGVYIENQHWIPWRTRLDPHHLEADWPHHVVVALGVGAHRVPACVHRVLHRHWLVAGGSPMNGNNLRIWAEIQALLVSVQGMEAENNRRESLGLAYAYGEEEFASVSNQIYQLSQQVKE